MFHLYIFRGKGSYLFVFAQKNRQKNDEKPAFICYFCFIISPSFFIPSIFIVKGVGK